MLPLELILVLQMSGGCSFNRRAAKKPGDSFQPEIRDRRLRRRERLRGGEKKPQIIAGICKTLQEKAQNLNDPPIRSVYIYG